MIELQRVSKSYGAAPVIDDLSLTIAEGEFVVLIGASGSGKSTTLRLLNRLVEPDSGQILFKGQPISELQPEALRRRMGYAIQSIGLFPHWTVAQNIATVPRLLNWPRAKVEVRVAELLNLLGLPPEQFSQRMPRELSGGQQQRVGVARALAADPDVLLMDEPFGALDPVTRASLQTELARIHRLSGKTIVLVTHDMAEALRLATRVVMLEHGRVLQIGTPTEFLTRPADDRVADFVGRADAGIQLLGLRRVGDIVRSGERVGEAQGQPIGADASLREALSLFITHRVDRLAVVDAQGQALGAIHFRDLLGDIPR